MKISCITDKRSCTPLSEDIWNKARAVAAEKGHTIERVDLDREETSACTGCLQCWKQQSRECVCRDVLGDMTRDKIDCDAVIYLTPVVFGTFSSAVKNAFDRSDLLFRNRKRAQLVIGYGNDVDDEERSTFMDLIVRHRGKADIVHPENKENISVFVTRSPKENDSIRAKIGELL